LESTDPHVPPAIEERLNRALHGLRTRYARHSRVFYLSVLLRGNRESTHENWDNSRRGLYLEFIANARAFAQLVNDPEIEAECALLSAERHIEYIFGDMGRDGGMPSFVALGRADYSAKGVDEALEQARTLRRPEIGWQAHLQRARAMALAYEAVAQFARTSPETFANWDNEATLQQLAQQAIYELEAAAAILEAIRARLPSSRTRAIFMQRDRAEVYARMVDMQLALGDERAALEWAERGKARAFLDMMGDRIPGGPSAEDIELAREQLALRDEITDLRPQISRSSGEDQRGTALELPKKLADGLNRYTQRLEQIGEASPELASTVSVRPRPLSEIQSALGEGEVMVEYYFGPRRERQALAWAIVADEVTCCELEMTGESLSWWVEAFRDNLSDPGDEYPQETAEKLYEVLLEPFAEQLEGATLLCVVPHGSLHYLPFHALRDGETFVVERMAVNYAPSGNALLFCRAKNPRRRASLVAVADPVSGRLSPLAYARAEAKAIAAKFTQADLVMGSEATEAAVARGGAGRDVVHFATHGEMNPWSPLLSCLHLTPTEDSDGRLEVHEIFNLDLDASLVALSACETALGEITSGDDMIGLSRAFMYAGTPSVAASLWRVDDEATAELMTGFYGALGQQSKAQALRSAQMAAIAEGRHPYYWAPFEVIGDWR
ncbi:MAG: CHAT domain-containing protein, partial [Armatimonadota bacterium]